MIVVILNAFVGHSFSSFAWLRAMSHDLSRNLINRTHDLWLVKWHHCMPRDHKTSKMYKVYINYYYSYHINIVWTSSASYIAKVVDLEPNSYKVQIWDTAGQEQVYSISQTRTSI